MARSAYIKTIVRLHFLFQSIANSLLLLFSARRVRAPSLHSLIYIYLLLLCCIIVRCIYIYIYFDFDEVVQCALVECERDSIDILFQSIIIYTYLFAIRQLFYSRCGRIQCFLAPWV